MSNFLPSGEIIIDDDLVLKLLNRESTARIFKVIDSNRKSLRKWLPFVDNTRKIENTEIFVKSLLDSNNPKPDILFEIWYHRHFTGIIALKEIDHWNKRTEIGYWLDPHFEKKGIMTRCCISLLDCAFKKIMMKRVQIKVGIGNAKSARIPEKLGFTFEGVERAGEKFPDHYADLEVYSMLKEEWLKKQL